MVPIDLVYFLKLASKQIILFRWILLNSEKCSVKGKFCSVKTKCCAVKINGLGCIFKFEFIFTYIKNLQRFSQDDDLASYTTYIVCVNLIP